MSADDAPPTDRDPAAELKAQADKDRAEKAQKTEREKAKG